jgi:hypothetical protein
VGGVDRGGQFRWGVRRVGGGHHFFGQRVGGVTTFFSLEERTYCQVRAFLGIFNHRLHRNAQKSLKQAVFEHFELIIGMFGKFFPIFRLFWLIFLFNTRICGRVQLVWPKKFSVLLILTHDPLWVIGAVYLLKNRSMRCIFAHSPNQGSRLTFLSTWPTVFHAKQIPARLQISIIFFSIATY